jgi:hypothetical protein
LLWVQAKAGLSSGFLISLAVAGGAILLMFVFLCVAAYAWLSIQLGSVFGGLAMAGVFLLMAVIGAQLRPPLRAIGPASGPLWSRRLGLKRQGP